MEPPTGRIALRLGVAVFALLAALLLAATSGDRGGEAPGIGLFQDLGDHHRKITTSSERAQRYFDQGLTLVYGFNHEAAVRSFQEAARLDPGCASCFWGIAYALGPNINAPMGPEAAPRALAAARTARSLAAGASATEQGLIEAVGVRYSDSPDADRAQLDAAFAEAMQALQRRFPDDPDVATLTAEALMDLTPWDYWETPERPRPHMVRAIGLLEAVLARAPTHPGANHYYIHAVEEHQPQKAVPSAERLAALAPDAGHLVHMPSHIFWRVGRYEDALEINRRASAADEAYFAWCRAGGNGLYRALYYPHNIHFLWAAAMAEGRSDLALTTSRRLVASIPPELLAGFPPAEEWLPIPLVSLVRFGRWDAVLGEPAPPPERRYWTGMWHYARGLARLRSGGPDAARVELDALAAVAAEEELGQLDFVGEPASAYLRLALAHLSGEIAAVRGDPDAAVRDLEQAIRIQDAMRYTEPPRWFFPVRQALGAVLLANARPVEAEAVYRLDLRKNPRNGWSLFGLAASLRAQGREVEADAVETGFRNAWARSDVTLAASRF